MFSPAERRLISRITELLVSSALIASFREEKWVRFNKLHSGERDTRGRKSDCAGLVLFNKQRGIGFRFFLFLFFFFLIDY